MGYLGDKVVELLEKRRFSKEHSNKVLCDIPEFEKRINNFKNYLLNFRYP